MVNDHFPMIFHHQMVHVWTNPHVLDGASSMQHPLPSCHQRLACFAKARATTGGPHRFGKHHTRPRKVVKPEVSIIDLLFNWNWNVPNTMESNINPSFFSFFCGTFGNLAFLILTGTSNIANLCNNPSISGGWGWEIKHNTGWPHG